MKQTKNEKLEKLAKISRSKPVSAKWEEIAKWNREHADALEDYATIATRILNSIKSQGMTQKQLAEALGVSPQALTRIVKGRQNLTLNTIRKIEKVLGLSILNIIKDRKPMMVVNYNSAFGGPIRYSDQDTKQYASTSISLSSDMTEDLNYSLKTA